MHLLLTCVQPQLAPCPHRLSYPFLTISAINRRLFSRNSEQERLVQLSGRAFSLHICCTAASVIPDVSVGQYAAGGLSDAAQFSGHSIYVKFAIWFRSLSSVIPMEGRYPFGNRWCFSIADLVPLAPGEKRLRMGVVENMTLVPRMFCAAQ